MPAVIDIGGLDPRKDKLVTPPLVTISLPQPGLYETVRAAFAHRPLDGPAPEPGVTDQTLETPEGIEWYLSAEGDAFWLLEDATDKPEEAQSTELAAGTAFDPAPWLTGACACWLAGALGLLAVATIRTSPQA